MASYSELWITNPWLPRPGSSRKPLWLGLFDAKVEQYFEPGRICSGRWFMPRVRDFVAAHVCTLAHSWCRPAQPDGCCHTGDILPIRWELGRCYHLFPAHRHECASHPVAYAPEVLQLCDITWISTRLWRYRVAYVPNTMSSCPLADPTHVGPISR